MNNHSGMRIVLVIGFVLTTVAVLNLASCSGSSDNGKPTITSTNTDTVLRAPEGPNPADNATDVPITTNLSWGAVPTATMYGVYFGNATSPAWVLDTATPLVNNADIGGPLAEDTKYYWRVVATDGTDNISGPEWTFTTAAALVVYEWENRSTTTPAGGKSWHTMSWDGMQVISYGGGEFNSSGYLLSYNPPVTWGWDGTNWSDLNPGTHPNACFGTSMCFDNRGALLYGGGGASGLCNETWRFSSGSWTQITTTGSPPALYCNDMTWDPSRDVVILFGGRFYNGSAYVPIDETWEFHLDNNTWIQITTPDTPYARYNHSMGFVGQPFVFGGRGATSFGGTWTYDNSTWTNPATSPYPSERYGMGLAHSFDESVAMLFGGYLSAINDQTWKWDGSAWEEVTFTGNKPSARYFCAMAFDRTRDEFVMFGGWDTASTNFSDTWVLKKQ